MKTEIVCRFNELADISTGKKYTSVELEDSDVKKILERKINENITSAIKNFKNNNLNYMERRHKNS